MTLNEWQLTELEHENKRLLRENKRLRRENEELLAVLRKECPDFNGLLDWAFGGTQ